MVQVCGAGVVPVVFKTCGNWGGWAWYISVVSISISSIVSQVEKAMSPWCRLLFYWGFNSMKSWRDSCGTVVFYVIRSEVFLSTHCVPRKGPSSLPRLCVPVERD